MNFPCLPLIADTFSCLIVESNELADWRSMVVLSISIFFFCKFLTWWTCQPTGASVGRQVIYLFAWTGMDAFSFLRHENEISRPTWIEWCFAVSKTVLGLVFLSTYASLRSYSPLAAGWVGMAGLIFVFHFGIFHLLACLWRSQGIDAVPLMNAPILSTGVFEFWGRRWNTAFRDLTHRFVFRPLKKSLPATWALVVGFLISGLVHDLVISVPARGGYGWPTAYFLLQAIAGLFERSRWGRWLGLGQGVRGWLFTVIAVIGPAPCLFHRPFVLGVVLPFLDHWGAFYVAC